MRSLWDDGEAAAVRERAGADEAERAVALRAYTSRLIGADRDLVLHGGGNTSVKVARGGRAVLHVKGSGWDLATIEAPGLPGLALEPLLAARRGPRLSDPDMVAFLRGQMTDPSGPNPSVETLLHAFLPAAFVDHTHAAAALVVANQPNAADLARTIFGDRLTVVPYVMPGFDLAVEADRLFRDSTGTEGLFLVNHGLFSLGDDARASYEGMITLAEACGRFIAANGAALAPPARNRAPDPGAALQNLAAALRGFAPFAGGASLDLRCNDPVDALLALPDLDEVAGRGTITPDHVIRLKPWPLVGEATFSVEEWRRRIEDYARAYAAYFDRQAPMAAEPKIMLDPFPRAVLVRGLGVAGIGRHAGEARICADLMDQAARVIVASETLGRFAPIREKDLFDMEYWSLEQAKLNHG